MLIEFSLVVMLVVITMIWLMLIVSVLQYHILIVWCGHSPLSRLSFHTQFGSVVKRRSTADLPPYFYTLREIGRRGKLDLPKRSHLIKALQDRGYQAAATHINPQGIKTNADLETCIAITRSVLL